MYICVYIYAHIIVHLNVYRSTPPLVQAGCGVELLSAGPSIRGCGRNGDRVRQDQQSFLGHVYIYTYIYIYIMHAYICIHIYIYVHTFELLLCVYASTCICIYTHIQQEGHLDPNRMHNNWQFGSCWRYLALIYLASHLQLRFRTLSCRNC